MKQLLLIFFLMFTLVSNPQFAFAGNAATVVLETGITFKLRQGYDQLSKAFEKYNKNDYANKFVELRVDGTTVAINLGRIVAVCRDDCTGMEIKIPKNSR